MTVSVTANKMTAADRAIHDWYRFVLSFPPHLVRDLAQRMDLGHHDLVLDPFTGTGTTLVECMKLGIPSVGVEALAMQFLASRVKTTWQIDPRELQKAALRVMGRLPQLLTLGLTPDAQKLLIKGAGGLPCIETPQLNESLRLKDAIATEPDDQIRAALQLALAKTAVADASRLRFAPTISVSKRKTFVEDVTGAWAARVNQMADDLGSYYTSVSARVIQGDSRQLSAGDLAGRVTAVISSPPYPCEADYSRSTRLESVILGLVEDKTQMQAQKRTLIRSNTRGIYADDCDRDFLNLPPGVHECARQIEEKRMELGQTNGFSRLYGSVVLEYFGGMARHLAAIRPLLSPGARLAYVVGDQASFYQVLIRTAPHLARIAEALGYEVENIELFRERKASKSSNVLLSEDILWLKWPGKSAPVQLSLI